MHWWRTIPATPFSSGPPRWGLTRAQSCGRPPEESLVLVSRQAVLAQLWPHCACRLSGQHTRARHTVVHDERLRSCGAEQRSPSLIALSIGLGLAIVFDFVLWRGAKPHDRRDRQDRRRRSRRKYFEHVMAVKLA